MDNLTDLINLYKKESANVFDNISNTEINQMIELVWNTYVAEKKIFSCGNGGNAGFVANLVSDFALHPFVAEDKSQPLNIEKRLICY